MGASGGFAMISTGTEQQKLANDLVAVGFTSATVTLEQSSASYKVFAGYEINENFSVEAYYAGLGKYDLTLLTTGPVVTGVGSVSLNAYGADLLAKLPLSNSSSVYLRAGYYQIKPKFVFTVTGPGGTASASSTNTVSNPKIGLGSDFKVTDSISLRTDWEYYIASDVPVNVISIGFAAHL